MALIVSDIIEFSQVFSSISRSAYVKKSSDKDLEKYF